MRISNIGSSQIEIFAALVERGSFSEAAQHLGLTQSAVSHGLARLETELGVVLVERGRRGVVLTPAGRAVLPQAREVLARLEAIRQAAASAGGAASGKLRVGTTSLLLPLPQLLGIVSRFRREYPGVELVLMDGSTREIETWITEGLIEVGVVSVPLSSGIDVRFLREEELCAILPQGHRFEQQSTVKLQEILHEPLLMPRFGRDLQAQLFQRRSDTPQQAEEGRPPLRHMVSDPASLCELVHAGLGIAILPRSIISTEGTDLKVLPFTPSFPVQVGLGVARAWASATPVARLFADCAEAWIKETNATPD